MTTDITPKPSAEEIAERVRQRYAGAALQVRSGRSSCCGDGSASGSSCCGGGAFGSTHYAAAELAALPEAAALASLGCGNPTALIELRPGDTVLDLGSGGGIDVLLSARRVGPTGFAFGLDMTDEMLALAEENKAKSGLTNVAFLKGRMEAIPLPANSVDVVISNCVINLAADKAVVLKEAFRVLKPGGRFAVSDVVADGPLPAALRQDMQAWVGCLAGALEIETYQALLAEAGFTAIEVEITHRYTAAGAGLDTSSLPAGWEEGDGRLASAFIRATKPSAAGGQPSRVSQQPAATGVAAGAGCCDSTCCA